MEIQTKEEIAQFKKECEDNYKKGVECIGCCDTGKLLNFSNIFIVCKHGACGYRLTKDNSKKTIKING